MTQVQRGEWLHCCPGTKPTPMAPPMAIMVSCLWPKRRWRPSTSGVGERLLAARVASTAEPCGLNVVGSVIAANTGRVRVQDHQFDILSGELYDCLHIAIVLYTWNDIRKPS